MKALTLTGLLTSAALLAHGQEYYLDLHKEALEVPGRNVALESVVDGRSEQRIGVIHYGAHSRPTTVFFQEGAAAELTALLLMPAPGQPVYLEVTPVAGTSKYWQWVPASQGQAALHELDSLAEAGHYTSFADLF